MARASRARGYGRARAALRRDGKRCAGAVPGLQRSSRRWKRRSISASPARTRLSRLQAAHVAVEIFAERRRAHPPIRCCRPCSVALQLPRRLRSNNPKQVAPDPDMRARLQPGSARKAESTSPISGCSDIAGGSRSLPERRATRSARTALNVCHRNAAAGIHGLSAFIASKAANTSLVAVAMPGLTRTACSVGKCERRRKHFAHAAHDARRADRGKPGHPRRWRRPPRAAAGRPSASIIQPRQKPQSRRGIGRAAAKSRRGRKIFRQFEMPEP